MSEAAFKDSAIQAMTPPASPVSPQADIGPAPGAASRSPGARKRPLIYVASRASVPERPAMWRALRQAGMSISSTWIDEVGEVDYGALWHRIESEISISDALMLYARKEDFPLKGALVEVGIALGMRKPVAVVLDGPTFLDPRTLNPIGSWLRHGRCEPFETLEEAYRWICRMAPAARTS